MTAAISEKAPCCCECGCGRLTKTLNARLICQAVGCPDPGVCTVAEAHQFTLTKITPVPAGLGTPCGVGGYWSGRPSLGCGDPADPLIEFVCCDSTGPAEAYLRINGTAWQVLSSDDEYYEWGEGGLDCDGCQCRWVLPFGGIGNDEIYPLCCGVWFFHLWTTNCDTPTDPPCA